MKFSLLMRGGSHALTLSFALAIAPGCEDDAASPTGADAAVSEPDAAAPKDASTHLTSDAASHSPSNDAGSIAASDAGLVDASTEPGNAADAGLVDAGPAGTLKWQALPGIALPPTRTGTAPKVVVDPSGRIVVSYVEGDAAYANPELLVVRLEGATWRSVGVLPVNGAPADRVGENDLAIDATGRLVVSYVIKGIAYLLRFEAGVWKNLANTEHNAGGGAGPYLALAKDGTPYLLTQQPDGSGGNQSVVHRYDGTDELVAVGRPLKPPSATRTTPAGLTVQSDGTPAALISAREEENNLGVFLMNFTGNPSKPSGKPEPWEALDGPLSNPELDLGYHDLIDTAQGLVVALRESDVEQEIYARSFDGVSGSFGTAVLLNEEGTNASYPQLAVSEKTGTFVTFREKRIWVKRFSQRTNSWETYIGPASPDLGATIPDIACDSAGLPVVVWNAYNPATTASVGVARAVLEP